MSNTAANTFKPSLTEKLDGIIWKIETAEKENIIAIESRVIAERISYYSAFNYVTGECVFKEKTVENGWFWSLDKVHNGRVFLHGYLHESKPEHNGIIALNAAGEVSWQHFNKALYDVSEPGLITYNPKIQPKLLELVSPLDGSNIQSKITDYLLLEREIIVPDMLDDTSIYHHLIPPNTTGPVFQKQINNKTIFAYHTQHQNLYTQQLLVYQDEILILQDILGSGIPKLNPEAFFIQCNHLFYIRNKQEIVSYLV